MRKMCPQCVHKFFDGFAQFPNFLRILLYKNFFFTLNNEKNWVFGQKWPPALEPQWFAGFEKVGKKWAKTQFLI